VKSGGSSAIIGSVEFSGTNDALVVPAGNDFAYGTGDFTIEAWIRPQGVNGGESKGIFTQTQAGNDYIVFKIDSTKEVKITISGTTVTGGTVEVGSWSHVAVTRASNIVKVFVNGIASSGTSITTDLNDTTRNPTIGQYTHSFGSLKYVGFISNLRVIKGTALYTSNFIPPTRKLTKLPGTVLLCCQDSNDPLTEATGKTITGYGDLQKADGVELVTNGTFDTDVSGWTEFESTNTWSSGKMQITRTGGGGRSTYQTFTTVPGYVYTITSEVNSVGSRGDIYIMYGTGWTNIDNPLLYLAGTNGQTRILSGHFTATTTTTTLAFAIDAGGTSIIVDNVSVTKIDPGNRASDFTPSVGSDGSVEFAGPTTINTENYFYLPTGPTEQRGRGRGVFGGGAQSPLITLNTIDYIQIQSTGNAIDFGDLTVEREIGLTGGASSSTRGLFAGGFNPNYTNVIDYITISSSANAVYFGDLTFGRFNHSSLSNSTRGLFCGGSNSSGALNVIDYVNISSTGNAISFGSLSTSNYGGGAVSSSTRGVVALGRRPADTNILEYVTIASTGSSQDFGDLTVVVYSPGCCSSNTRGLFAGNNNPTGKNNIDYITIASTGNAVKFGDLTRSGNSFGGTSNSIRGVFAGGYSPAPTIVNTIDFVTIASTGNAQDFGDLTIARRTLGACSDSHGGLG
jgi:hypothetical protein